MKKYLLLILLLISTQLSAESYPKRIITIGGALTEIVYELEKQDLLIGSDTTSYFPKAAEALPKVGYQRALSAEGILSLNPDLLIVTEEAGPKEILEQVNTANVKLLKLKAGRSIQEIIDNIKIIAAEIDANEKAKFLIQDIQDKKIALDKLVAKETNKQKVMFILQHGGGSPMVAGKKTAADSIINLSGAKNAVIAYEGYKPLTPEAAIAQAPDIILITQQGLEQVGGEESLMQTPGLALTPAGMNGNIIAMDSLLMLGFGPRTVDAATQLYEKYRQQ